MMQFELFGVERVHVETAVVYVDHNILQIDFKNLTITASCRRCRRNTAPGSRAPGTLCHYVHCERFAVPGKTLIGADSHTTQSGSCAMIAIGAGGLDVAVCMARHPLRASVPQDRRRPSREQAARPWIQAKDIILERCSRGVRGGRGCIFEFHGPGVATLSYTERGTIANMIAELGATGAVFPFGRADTRVAQEQEANRGLRRAARRLGRRLRRGGGDRSRHARPAGREAPPAREMSSPSRRWRAQSWRGHRIDLLVNSSATDLLVGSMCVEIGQKACFLCAAARARRILDQITRSSTYVDLLTAGVRMLEPACRPCPEWDRRRRRAPPRSARSTATSRAGRGTADDQVYLCSPAVAAASMLTGVISDPRELRVIDLPERPTARPEVVQKHILEPAHAEEASGINVPGANIKPPPEQKPLPDDLKRVLIVAPDDISARRPSRPAAPP